MISRQPNGSGSISRIIIAGPTGVGKTATSLSLVRQLGLRGIEASIISADSRQCYRYLDIGTGKVTDLEKGDIPHYNISIMNPDQPDSAASFVKRSTLWEDEISRSGQLPIYVGGSTLHLQSLIWPLDDLPEACVQNLVKLRQVEESEGRNRILEMLQHSDPVYISKMDGYNRQRIFRALDVFMQTGKPFSSYHSNHDKSVIPDGTLLIVLVCERQTLRDRIQARVEKMLENGLIDETRSILKMGFDEQLQSLQTVGYKESISFLKGEIDEMTLTEQIISNTRSYAKRQMTWFRRWKTALTIDCSEFDSEHIASKIIMHIN